MEMLIFLLSAIILTLVVLNAFLLFYSLKTNKKIDLLLEKGKIKDLRDVLFGQIEKTKEQESQLKEVFDRIKNLENISEKTFQKIGIVRFNPFNDIGGNQSFVIALLDNQNNGFVISSLFIKEGNRVYAKSVVNGKSDYLLSNEEQEAITRAIGSR
jgi:hypothetical protein